jgi:hypothetical protein
MKYKVGDLVRVRSLDWWEHEPKGSDGGIRREGCTWFFMKFMTVYCGKVFRVGEVADGWTYTDYRLDGTKRRITWADWMFEPYIENIRQAEGGDTGILERERRAYVLDE